MHDTCWFFFVYVAYLTSNAKHSDEASWNAWPGAAISWYCEWFSDAMVCNFVRILCGTSVLCSCENSPEFGFTLSSSSVHHLPSFDIHLVYIQFLLKRLIRGEYPFDPWRVLTGLCNNCVIKKNVFFSLYDRTMFNRLYEVGGTVSLTCSNRFHLCQATLLIAQVYLVPVDLPEIIEYPGDALINELIRSFPMFIVSSIDLYILLVVCWSNISTLDKGSTCFSLETLFTIDSV